MWDFDILKTMSSLEFYLEVNLDVRFSLSSSIVSGIVSYPGFGLESVGPEFARSWKFISSFATDECFERDDKVSFPSD